MSPRGGAPPSGVFRVIEPIEDIGAEPGDFVVIQAEDADAPYTLVRCIDRERAMAALTKSAPVGSDRPPAPPAMRATPRPARPGRQKLSG